MKKHARFAHMGKLTTVFTEKNRKDLIIISSRSQRKTLRPQR